MRNSKIQLSKCRRKLSCLSTNVRIGVKLFADGITVAYPGIGTSISESEQAREFLFFPLLPREASKRVPIFDRGTGFKPGRLRSGSLQADLS